MNQNTFTGLITNICATFGRKPPARESLDRWWIKVMAVPDEAVPWITEQLEERDDLPKNLPAAINGLWWRWREQNPGRCATEEKPRGCSRCTEGRIYYVRQVDGGTWYPFIAVCGHCMPAATGPGIVRLTVKQIESHGYEWVPESKALSICSDRNKTNFEARESSFNAIERLQSWKEGKKPDERCDTPDDDRPDVTEGWF